MNEWKVHQHQEMDMCSFNKNVVRLFGSDLSLQLSVYGSKVGVYGQYYV